MSNDKASKRPWSKGTSNQAGTRPAAFGGILSGDHIFDAWGENAEANTELIVTAVNEREALKAENEELKDALEYSDRLINEYRKEGQIIPTHKVLENIKASGVNDER